MALAIVKEWKATRVTVGSGRLGRWKHLQLAREKANDGRLDDGGIETCCPLIRSI